MNNKALKILIFFSSYLDLKRIFPCGEMRTFFFFFFFGGGEGEERERERGGGL